MRRLALACVTLIVLTGALGLIARADGPIPDCLYVGSTAGAGLIPAASETPVCETGIDDGRHAIKFGWTAGATATATIEVAADDDGRTAFRVRCAVLGGIAQCQTTSTVPYEGIEFPFELLGPFNAQRIAVITLAEPATVKFSAGPYNHTFTCIDSCARVVIAEGVLGLTIDEGRAVQCLLLPGQCEPSPCDPQPLIPFGILSILPFPAGSPGPEPTPTPTPEPTPTATPCPEPSGTATPTPTQA